MKMEADVWRLNEIAVTVRLPLADPDFLKSIEDRQRAQNQQMNIWTVRSVNAAEASYKAATGSYACDLTTLANPAKQSSGVNQQFLWDTQLASGRKNGYVFVISGCDGSHYKIVGEPATADSGQRALCSDDSGTIRTAADGKATTCLSSGEELPEQSPTAAIGAIAAASEPQQPGSTPRQARRIEMIPASPRNVETKPPAGGVQDPGVQRVRVSQRVMQSLVISKVYPQYPSDAKIAKIEGAVVLAAIISKEGNVQSLKVVNSDSPLLSQAAMDAVKQWKYRPYILNGSPVEVDTTVTVNFTMAK
jgi:TonB family protein